MLQMPCLLARTYSRYVGEIHEGFSFEGIVLWVGFIDWFYQESLPILLLLAVF